MAKKLKFRGTVAVGSTIEEAGHALLGILTGKKREFLVSSDDGLYAVNSLKGIKYFDPTKGVVTASILKRELNLELSSTGSDDNKLMALSATCPTCTEVMLSQKVLAHCLICASEIPEASFEETEITLPTQEEMDSAFAEGDNFTEEETDALDESGDKKECDEEEVKEDEEVGDECSASDKAPVKKVAKKLVIKASETPEDDEEDDEEEEEVGDECKASAVAPVKKVAKKVAKKVEASDEEDDIEIEDVEGDTKSEDEEDVDDLELMEESADDDDLEIEDDEEGDEKASDDEEDDEEGDEKASDDEEDEDVEDVEGTGGDEKEEDEEIVDEEETKEEGDFFINDEGNVDIDMLEDTEPEETDQVDVEYSASLGGAKRWIASVNKMPVAFIEQSAAGANSKIFHTESFGKVVKEVITASGLKGLKALGFSPVMVSAPIKGLISTQVQKEVSSVKKALDSKIKATASEFQTSLCIAAAGINRSFFADTVDPLKQQLWQELSAIGIPNPSRLLDRVFKEVGEDYCRVMIEKASELQAKPEDIRAELSKAIVGANYIAVAEEEEIEDEEVDGDEIGDEEDDEQGLGIEESMSRHLASKSNAFASKVVGEVQTAIASADGFDSKLDSVMSSF